MSRIIPTTSSLEADVMRSLLLLVYIALAVRGRNQIKVFVSLDLDINFLVERKQLSIAGSISWQILVINVFLGENFNKIRLKIKKYHQTLYMFSVLIFF